MTTFHQNGWIVFSKHPGPFETVEDKKIAEQLKFERQSVTIITKFRHEAVRRLMNTLKVDGLTRALTRQLLFVLFLVFPRAL